MRGKRDAAWQYAKQGEKNWEVYCAFCNCKVSGGINRLKYHLAGLKCHNVKPCPIVLPEVKAKYICSLGSEEQGRLWTENACTIMSGEWTNGRNQGLINFCVASKGEIKFFESVDASQVTVEMLAQKLGEVVLEVGQKNVVQVITDKTAMYEAAGRILKGRFPTIFWAPCVAHCLDLLLEEIEKLPWVSEVIKKAKYITEIFYNNREFCELMRQSNRSEELEELRFTCFGINLLTLQSLFDAKDTLSITLSYTDLSRYMHSTEYQKVKGYVLNDPHFWSGMKEAIEVSETLKKVLEKNSSMGYVYKANDKAKKAVAKFFKDETLIYTDAILRYNRICEIIDGQWISFDIPLHIVGYYLNPFFYDDSLVDNKVRLALEQCLVSMVADEDTRELIRVELEGYKSWKVAFFTSGLLSTLSPDLWWEKTGGDNMPNLQRLAIKILGQPCSASSCKQDRSMFDHIPSKKHNRVMQQKDEGTSYKVVDLDENDPSSEQITEPREEQQREPLVMDNFESTLEFGSSAEEVACTSSWMQQQSMEFAANGQEEARRQAKRKWTQSSARAKDKGKGKREWTQSSARAKGKGIAIHDS